MLNKIIGSHTKIRHNMSHTTISEWEKFLFFFKVTCEVTFFETIFNWTTLQSSQRSINRIGGRVKI